MKVNGGCHCGQITYEAEIDPEKVGICHCTDCQTGSGSGFRTNVQTLKGTFKLLSGEPRIYMKTAESGNKRAQGFCANWHAALLDDGDRPAGLRAAPRVDQAALRAAAAIAGLVPLGAGVDAGYQRAAEVREATARRLRA